LETLLSDTRHGTTFAGAVAYGRVPGMLFVTYNRTERELRPAIPLYAGSFGAGMLEAQWLPGQRNIWRQGVYGALGQAGWGSAYNWASEFAIDILRKITKQRYPRPEPETLLLEID
jgi:hypothetical protein